MVFLGTGYKRKPADTQEEITIESSSMGKRFSVHFNKLVFCYANDDHTILEVRTNSDCHMLDNQSFMIHSLDAQD